MFCALILYLAEQESFICSHWLPEFIWSLRLNEPESLILLTFSLFFNKNCLEGTNNQPDIFPRIFTKLIIANHLHDDGATFNIFASVD
jgi:hypothetical protein